MSTRKAVQDMFDARNAGKTTIFMIVAVALFLIPFAGVANAVTAYGNEMGMGGHYGFSYNGTITAIDHSAKTVTVKAGMNNSRIFNLAKDYSFTKCGVTEPVKNLKVGDRVSVSYFQNGANDLIAGNISLMLPAGQHC
jgi:hypothetical protein